MNHAILRQQGSELTRDMMRSAIIQPEHVRKSISGLNARHAFDRERLVTETRAAAERGLRETVRMTYAMGEIRTSSAEFRR